MAERSTTVSPTPQDQPSDDEDIYMVPEDNKQDDEPIFYFDEDEVSTPQDNNQPQQQPADIEDEYYELDGF